MKGQTRKVVHLEYDGEHRYFGSITALSEKFGKDKIGIGYGGLVNALRLTPGVYRNKKCIVRVGTLEVKERGTK